MASETKAPQREKEKDEEKEADTPDAPLPLLDLSDTALTNLIRTAKERGTSRSSRSTQRCPRRRSNPSRSRTS